MFQRVIGWIVVAILVFGVGSWLAEGNNGKQAGRTAGTIGSTGKNAIGGALDVGVGFVNGLSH